MIGSLPSEVLRYRAVAGRTVVEPGAARAPEAGEVVIAVAGSAVGGAAGAEVSGRVVAAGDAASDWLGRRVVVPRLLPCGECDACRRARPARCPSIAPRDGLASHETVPARYLLSVEPPLHSDREPLWALAALADAASTSYAALVRAQVAPGDLCIVVGGGVRGRFAVALAKARGAHAAILDEDPALVAMARLAGARFVVDRAGLDGRAARRSIVEQAAANGIVIVDPKVIETTGAAAGRRRAVELVAEGGTAALIADGDREEIPLSVEDLARNEGVLTGSAACHPDLFVELMAFVVRGDLALAAEARPLPFSALAEAMAAVASGELRQLPILTNEASGGVASDVD